METIGLLEKLADIALLLSLEGWRVLRLLLTVLDLFNYIPKAEV